MAFKSPVQSTADNDDPGYESDQTFDGDTIELDGDDYADETHHAEKCGPAVDGAKSHGDENGDAGEAGGYVRDGESWFGNGSGRAYTSWCDKAEACDDSDEDQEEEGRKGHEDKHAEDSEDEAEMTDEDQSDGSGPDSEMTADGSQYGESEDEDVEMAEEDEEDKDDDILRDYEAIREDYIHMAAHDGQTKLVKKLLREEVNDIPHDCLVHRLIFYNRYNVDLLIRKRPFLRLVREIADKYQPGVQFESTALRVIQEAAEAAVIARLNAYQTAASHADREEMTKQDVDFINCMFRNDGASGYNYARINIG